MSKARLNETHDPHLDISRGLWNTRDNPHVYGLNKVVPNANFVDIWTGDTHPYPWLTVAEPIRIRIGGGVNDTATGSGAQGILADCLDEDFNPLLIPLITDGISASVKSTRSILRLNLASVAALAAGTYSGTNDQDIIIEGANSGATLAHIPAGLGISPMSHRTIPAGWTGFIRKIDVSCPVSKPCDLRIFFRPGADKTESPFYAKCLLHEFPELTGHESIRPDGKRVEEKTDIWAEGKGKVGSSVIAANYTVSLFKNG